MKALHLLLFLFFVSGVEARADQVCFAGHLRAAIALNSERKAIYSELSDGASDKVSRVLILGERIALPQAMFLELEARKYQRAGIPILCDEFASMSTVPPISMTKAEVVPAPAFMASDPAKIWSEQVRKAYDQDGFGGASASASQILEGLQSTPRFFCMARHLLSSIVRVANLAPVYERAALEKGMKSPLGISRSLLMKHLSALSLSIKVDRPAAVVQAQGIPIVCGDVPEIVAW